MLPPKKDRLRTGLWVLVAAMLGGGGLVHSASAQCPPEWLPGHGLAGVDWGYGGGGVNAVVAWDIDGDGPRSEVLVLGGSFQVAGSALASNLACWDPATSSWFALGTGTNGTVAALAVLDGKLYLGGLFSVAGGTSVSNIACFDPVTLTWSGLGAGTNGSVSALTVLDGRLYAGGGFSTAGAANATGVACWNPTTSSWSSMGGGLNGSVSALTALDGKLYAGGDFTEAGGLYARSIACWDPAALTWSSLGLGVAGSYPYVFDLTVFDGKLYVGGRFTTAGGADANNIGSWDPNALTWSTLGSGTEGDVLSLTVLNGQLYVGGVFGLAGGVDTNLVARWDPVGLTWSALGSGLDGEWWEVHAIAALNGRLYVGGSFDAAGDHNAHNLACWDPEASTWLDMGSGLGDYVTTLDVMGGKLYAGGAFLSAGGKSAGRVACWDPATSGWSPLGSGVNGYVYALAVLDGKLYAGGSFTTAGTVSASRIACWDPASSTWSALGSGISDNGNDARVRCLAALDGRLYVGGEFTTAGGIAANGIATWDPATRTWSALGFGVQSQPQSSMQVFALAVLEGRLYVGGSFPMAGGVTASSLASWDPALSTWSALGAGLGGLSPWVWALAVMDGKLYAGGRFETAGGHDAHHIACWDPSHSTWSALGAGIDGTYSTVHALAAREGRLYVGGNFFVAGGVVVNRIACWDPAAAMWSAMGTGMNDPVWALTFLEDTLHLGGSFTTAGGQVSAYWARWGRPGPKADFDCDLDVDGDDLNVLETCMTGPGVPYDDDQFPPSCPLVPNGQSRIAADSDEDGDVDQSDFGVFQRCFSGIGILADPACDG